jgi:hypothetical protein
MFGALNRFISRLDAEPTPEQSPGPRRGACGFQILRNENHDIPAEPWYDFVVGINGRQIVSSSLRWSCQAYMYFIGQPRHVPIFPGGQELCWKLCDSHHVER